MSPEWHLKEADFFSGLPAEKEAFLACAAKRSLKKNDPIFSAGEAGNSCFYLNAGLVKISRISFYGKEPIIFVRRTGELFGLAEVIEGKKRKCNAQALTACTLFEIQSRQFEALLAQNYSLARRVIEILGQRLRYLGEQIENLMVCDVATRLLKLFLYITYPKLVDLDSFNKPVELPVSLTQEQLAACIGSCQQTVSETLKSLEKDGLIWLSKKKITLARPFEIMELVLDN